ncbi:MAG: sulfatase [Planctomycetota bacterium]
MLQSAVTKFSRILFRVGVAFILMLAFGSSSLHAADAMKPNIVLIFIDDMGYGDIGPFGSTKNRTPNLDRMAAGGMKLTSFYAAPVCSVSRAQVMTGCYGPRVSIPAVFGPGGRNGISKNEHTVAELLKAQGYATICIGKWHLGDQPEFLPTRHGFDHYFGLPYSNDMMKKAKVNGKLVVPLVRDEKVIELLEGDDQDRLTERYTDEALKFINENKEHPFFLYLPHTAVHSPIHPGANFRDKSTNGRFGAWVEEVDWSTGKILDTLRDLKLADNTLVLFTSDNGPWLSHGKDAGEAGPLRGGKGSTWEGGMREPTLAMWPGKIAPGSVCNAVAGTIDFLPTFVKLAGGSVPTDKKIDGKDIAPLLFGMSTESQREAHFYFQGYKLQAVRSGPWKMAFANQNESMGHKGEATVASLDKPRLYNLDKDIGERTDVAAENADVIARLKPLVVKMTAEIGDGAKNSTEIRPAGSVENPVLLYPVDHGEKEAPRKAKK